MMAARTQQMAHLNVFPQRLSPWVAMETAVLRPIQPIDFRNKISDLPHSWDFPDWPDAHLST
jgi:hypothetical protein